MNQTPLDRESLQVLLAKVHERLSEAGSVDTASREQLHQVMADLERALGEGDTGGIIGSKGAASASGVARTVEASTPRLESLAVRFEADHPGLAATLRRLIDLLGKAGI
jgi:hypothetical protein